MLSIKLNPNSLICSNMSDALAEGLPREFLVKWDENKGYIIKGSPEQLYNLLLYLSCNYDLEIS